MNNSSDDHSENPKICDGEDSSTADSDDDRKSMEHSNASASSDSSGQDDQETESESSAAASSDADANFSFSETDVNKQQATQLEGMIAGDLKICGNVLLPAEKKRKKSRKTRHTRKKLHFNAIRQQMEFYFGDANLTKDRFLMQLIQKDPYVDINVFLQFNKIKKMTEKSEDIAMALSNSKLIEVSKDGQKISRRLPIPTAEDRQLSADERTIYVESLPPDATHDWTIEKFKCFGPVAYVSLPKYRNSQKIKEFAFVEFEQLESAVKCLKAFKSANNLLYTERADPAALLSVKAFNIENEIVFDNDEAAEKCLEPETAVPTNNDDPDENKAASTIEMKEVLADAEETKKNKKLRRKSRRSKKTILQSKIEQQQQRKSKEDSGLNDLKILSKKDWKRLRNRYLNLQREQAKKTKRKKINELQRQHNKQTPTKSSGTVVAVSKAIVNSQQNSTSTVPRNSPATTTTINFYGAAKQTNESNDEGIQPPPNKENLNLTCYSNTEGLNRKKRKNSDQLTNTDSEIDTENSANQAKKLKKSVEEKPPQFQFESGIILHLQFLTEPCDAKVFKQSIRTLYPQIQYVDVTMGAFEAYLRVDTPQNTEIVCNAINKSNQYKAEILTDAAELQYWEKIRNDRIAKLNKTVKIAPVRGRQRLKAINSKYAAVGGAPGEKSSTVTAAGFHLKKNTTTHHTNTNHIRFDCD